MIVKTERSTFAKLFDIVLTLLAWIGFVYLIAGGVAADLQGTLAGPTLPFWSALLPTVHTLLIYFIAGVVNSLVLIGWAQYNRARFGGMDRRKFVGPLVDDTQLHRFCSQIRHLSDLRRARTSVVHHDAIGRITAVTTPPPRLVSVPQSEIVTAA